MGHHSLINSTILVILLSTNAGEASRAQQYSEPVASSEPGASDPAASTAKPQYSDPRVAQAARYSPLASKKNREPSKGEKAANGFLTLVCCPFRVGQAGS